MVSGLHQFGLSVTPGGRKLRESQQWGGGKSAFMNTVKEDVLPSKKTTLKSTVTTKPTIHTQWHHQFLMYLVSKERTMNNALPLQAGDQNGTMTIDSASSRDERLLYRRDNFLGQLS